MTTATGDTAAPTLAEQPVPHGYWQREASHAPRPMSPLYRAAGLAYVNAGFRRMFADLGVLPETLEWREIRGWAYTRLVPPGGRDRAAPPAVLMPLISRIAPPFRRSAAAAAEAIRTDRHGRYLELWFDEWRDGLTAIISSLRAVDLAGCNETELEKHLLDVLALLEYGIDVHFRVQGGYAVMMAELAFTCRDLLGWDDRQMLRLLRGLSPASTEPGRRLAELATLARSRPAVRALVERADPAAAAALAEADAEFAGEFAAYLHRYGFRSICYNVLDPTIAETPELALRLIRDQLATGYDPDAEDAASRIARARAREQARSALSGAGLARFDRALARAERIYPVREECGPATFNEPLALLRHTALEVGRRLVAAGRLTRSDDTLFLELDELLAALRGAGTDLVCTVGGRRAEHDWVLANPGPASYGPEPAPPPSLRWLPTESRFVNEATAWMYEHSFGIENSSKVQSGVVLTGTPAAVGNYTGPVRVIHDEDEFDKLQPGDVLVCPITSPVWSVLFPSVGALVTDSGGILCHPAIIAREHGIPAVVATGNATSLLRDGQRVTVDGSTGTVRVSS